MPFGPKGLVVTWVGPIPKEARVTFVDSRPFSAANKVLGGEIPKSFPKKYRASLQSSQVFTTTVSWSSEEVVRTQKRFEIDMERRPMEIFEDYLKRGFLVLSSLVEHPSVPEPRRFARCSVVLQRALLVSNPPWQTILLRSYFHSAASDDQFVNFAPNGGLRITYPSDDVWFPLELTSVISEPAAHVVLDILTQQQLQEDQVPTPFAITARGTMTFEGRRYQVARVRARLAADKKWADLRIPGGGQSK